MSAGDVEGFAIDPTVVRAWTRYPAYKDSGVEWLGEVPEHWEVRRLKTLCLRSALYGANVAATAYTTTGVRFIRTTDITEDGHLKETGVFVPEELVKDYLLKGGDVLISRSGTVGRAFLYDSGEHGPCAYAGYLVRFVPSENVLPKFVFLFTKTQAFADFLQVTAISSTIENVNGEKYANATWLLPPLPEQHTIVAFLDRETARIDALIEKKHRFIELLEEKRQALITHAVTKGLDPDVEMKDSGVEWIGEVPTHWEVRAFTRCAIEQADYRGATPTKTESGIFLVTAKNIRKGWIDYEASREFVSEIDYLTIMRRGLPQLGDLLLTTEAPLGYAALVDREDIALAQRVIRFRMDPSLFEPRFVLYSVLSPYFQNQMLCQSTGSTVLGIKASKLPQLKILCPPVSEQRQILALIDKKCAMPDKILERANRQIALFKEYRTALISAAVTGKIDVRDEGEAA